MWKIKARGRGAEAEKPSSIEKKLTIDTVCEKWYNLNVTRNNFLHQK
jgi:hypothetical protein